MEQCRSLHEGASRLAAYEVAGEDLGPGASFGNGHTWLTTGSDGRIRSLFSTDIGEEVAAPMLVRYSTPDVAVLAPPSPAAARSAEIPLDPVGAGRFVIHPTSQCRFFELPGQLQVAETVWVPQVPEGETGDETAAYFRIRVTNGAGLPRSVSVYALVRFAGSRRSPTIRGEYDAGDGALLAWEEEHDDWVRTLGSTRDPDGHALTDDFGCLYDTDTMPALADSTEIEGDVVGALRVPLSIEPGRSEQFTFILAFGVGSRERAVERLGALRDVVSVMEAETRNLDELLNTSRVMTPDPVINDGVFWSKVNMLRVLARYPRGLSFTNEPGVSSNVVARDAAWFVYGCDHFLPSASRQLLNELIASQYDNGMIPEYFDARTGRTEDYGLNINDGTPLFILAVNHHVRSTGDLDYLRSIYDSVAGAARYILSQRDDRGLVFCRAEGTEVHGICSWRNVIPDYRINGAVTEVNAECAAALRAMGHMSENIGRSDDHERFYGAAEDLSRAINTHLLDEDRRLYLLNIDTAGRRHSDVTADELFPVLFRVAPQEVAFRIIRRLNSPDFWTPGGLRTCSRSDPLYDPARYVGLRGGVWPGLTWWYAFAAARYHPEFMVKGLRAAYQHYNRHPRLYNTVPGQFSEWFDGESLVNRGMLLSPWEPPRFLWAAMEGVCGLMLSPQEPGIRPLIPRDWLWCSAANVPYHGRSLTAFAARMGNDLHVYANTDFREAGAKVVLSEDLTDRISTGHVGLYAVALRDGGRTVAAVGSCREEAVTTPLSLRDIIRGEERYRLREYSSEKGEWTEEHTFDGSAIGAVALRVQPGGFHLLDIARAGS